MTHAHVIGSIYEAALDPGHLGKLLEGVSVHADATIGHIDIEDAASGKVMFVAVHRMAPEMRDEYLCRYRAIDPRRALLGSAGPGEWRLTQDHFDEAFLRRSPFYRDFAIPRGSGHGAVTYLDLGCFRGFMCIGRALRQGPFPDASRRRLASLTPHLRRASALRAQSGRSLAMQFAFRALLEQVADAIMIVTRDSRMLWSNARGRALLDDRDGLQVSGGFVTATDPKAKALLARTIEVSALAGPLPHGLVPQDASLRLPKAESARPWLVSVLPIAPPTELGAVDGIPCAALWVRDPQREERITPAWLQFALNVTPAEARVAHEVFFGASVAEAAQRLGIGEATAKTHLTSVFAKTGVRRQADLVRFISNLRPNFR